jgi:O-antigen/teichoic acid export membrane protein
MSRQAVSLVMGAGTAVITARALGAEGRGEFVLATLWVGLFALVLPMSIGYGFIYHIGQRRFSLSEALSNALTFALVVGLFGAVLATAAGLLWGPDILRGVSAHCLLVAALGVPAMVFTGTAGLCLTGAGLIRLGARIGAISSVTGLALCALLVLGLKLGVVGALLAVTANAYLSSALFFLMVSPHAPIRPALDPAAIALAVRFGLKLHAGFIAQFLNYRLDRFIISFFLGPAAVGIYGIAVLLSELIWNVPGAVSNALYPRTSSTRADSAELTAGACRVSLLVVGLLCVVAAVVGPALIPLVFGAEFAAAGPVFWALLPGVLALTAGKVLAPYLVGHNRPIVGTLGSVASLVATVVLDLLLIPRWGILGAGIASSLAYIVGATIFVIYYQRVSRMPLRAAVVPLPSDLVQLRRLVRTRPNGVPDA